MTEHTINKDRWVPACGGTEVPVTIKGRRLLYMWNQTTGEHAHLDLDTDIFLTRDEFVELFS